MLIPNKRTLFAIIIINCGYSIDCTYNIEEYYFNENILTYYVATFDRNNAQSQIDIFSYKITSQGDNCNATIEYTLQIYAPQIGLTDFEIFFQGKTDTEINLGVQYINNTDFIFGSSKTVENNAQNEKLISYISQSGKLPNGKYLFQLTIYNDELEILPIFTRSVDINRPVTLNLLSPGGTMSEISSTAVYNTAPLFTWYSDFCDRCNYGIRICEYNQNEHNSLNEALSDRSLLPWDQTDKYYILPSNAHSFQIPATGAMDLEVGKHYVWQIRRSYETTLETYHDYSSVNIFEVRSPTKEQIDFSDPYLSVIQSLIGKEKFYLLFSSGGELEQFVTKGESIWINNEELHIDVLYSLVSELNNGKIKIENIKIK